MYVVLDLETGSLNPNTGAICSIACLALDEDLNETHRYYTLVNEPGKLVEDAALAINKLTREEISKGKPIEKVLSDLKIIMRNRIPIAHNGRFDFGFLAARGFEFDVAIDTLMIAKKLFPKQKNNLTELCQRLNIQVENTHNSLGDCLLTAEALRKMSKTQWLNALEPRPIGKKI